MRTRTILVTGLVFGLLLSACAGGSSDRVETVDTVVITGQKTYRQASSSMEPTLHCARPGAGCEAARADVIVAEPVAASDLDRGDIVVFETPPEAASKCGAGGTFVKRIIGLPGETVRIGIRDGLAYVYVDDEELDEPYIEDERRDSGPAESFSMPEGHYFVMGDNRSQSCDSRIWGFVPERNFSERVTQIVRAK